LSILNKRYEDVFNFCDIFSEMEVRDEAIAVHLAAGLVTTGKHLIAQENWKGATTAFQKATTFARSKPAILAEGILTLYRAGLTRQARELLAKMPDEVHAHPDIAIMDLELLDSSGKSAQALQFAMDLLNRNITSPFVYEVVIRRSIEAGRPFRLVEETVQTAIKQFPESEAHFQSFLRPKKAEPK
jgi:hypothetical protein